VQQRAQYCNTVYNDGDDREQSRLRDSSWSALSCGMARTFMRSTVHMNRSRWPDSKYPKSVSIIKSGRSADL
jgi:hypothetical protein